MGNLRKATYKLFGDTTPQDHQGSPGGGGPRMQQIMRNERMALRFRSFCTAPDRSECSRSQGIGNQAYLAARPQ